MQKAADICIQDTFTVHNICVWNVSTGIYFHQKWLQPNVSSGYRFLPCSTRNTGLFLHPKALYNKRLFKLFISWPATAACVWIVILNPWAALSQTILWWLIYVFQVIFKHPSEDRGTFYPSTRLTGRSRRKRTNTWNPHKNQMLITFFLVPWFGFGPKANAVSIRAAQKPTLRNKHETTQTLRAPSAKNLPLSSAWNPRGWQHSQSHPS